MDIAAFISAKFTACKRRDCHVVVLALVLLTPRNDLVVSLFVCSAFIIRYSEGCSFVREAGVTEQANTVNNEYRISNVEYLTI